LPNGDVRVRRRDLLAWLESQEEVWAPHAAAKTRKSMAEALTTVTLALLSPRRRRPDEADLRRTL
jgi:hypothetical protein